MSLAISLCARAPQNQPTLFSPLSSRDCSWQFYIWRWLIIPTMLLFALTPVYANSIANEHWTYTYDANGNITTITNQRGQHIYQYDALNRLTHDQRPAQGQQHSYDRNGNRTQRDKDGQITSYTYTPNSNQPETVNGETITKDAIGNITYDGRFHYRYNQAGRLSEVKIGDTVIATYVYNAFGQRTRKTISAGTTFYHYDIFGQLVAETHKETNTHRSYIHMQGTPVAQIDTDASGNDKIYYLHNDHLGTPRKATDAQGNIVWQWNSDAFGNTAANPDPDGDGNLVTINLRFSGQYYDEETGLHYNWHRYYDPEKGAYMTSDPIGLSGGLNTYGYVGGNPVGFYDPDGRFIQSAVGACFVWPVGTISCTAVGLSLLWAANNDSVNTSNNVTLIPNVSSSIYDDAESAGQEAANELDDEAQCPPAEASGHGPNCQDIARNCTEKCIGKYAGKGPMSTWISVCKASCMKSKGCSPVQERTLFP